MTSPRERAPSTTSKTKTADSLTSLKQSGIDTGGEMSDILGIHHVTAVAGDPQQNVEFYAGVLGLRLVKLTVNYDDPTA